MFTTRPQVEVTIICEDLVRDYAAGELDSDLCAEIEELLLQDEKAREIVRTEGSAAEKLLLSPGLYDDLQASISACRKALIYYVCLTNTPAPKTVKEFANSRLSERWSLYEWLSETQRLAGNRETRSLEIKLHPDGKQSFTTIMNSAEECDEIVIKHLKHVYAAAMPPKWKAMCAQWIAGIEDDKSRISWLNSVSVRQKPDNNGK